MFKRDGTNLPEQSWMYAHSSLRQLILNVLLAIGL